VRAALPAWVIFGGIFGATILLGAYVAMTKEPALWYPTGVAVCILAVILSWLGTTALTLNESTIKYRSLLVGRGNTSDEYR
jgi:hypothetical protein